MSDTFWLVEGFDVRQWKRFIPDPGLFISYHEAMTFCEEYTVAGEIYYGCRAVTLGHMPVKKRKVPK